jgi:hypothetical protein
VKWQSVGDRIRLQFRLQGSRRSCWVSAAEPKPWGLRLVLAGSERRLPDVLDVVWQAEASEYGDPARLWEMIRSWLHEKFPGHQLLRVSRRPDLACTISGGFLRVHFRLRGKDCLLVAAGEDAAEEAHRVVSQALLWLNRLHARKKLIGLPVIHLLVPSACSATVRHRCAHLNGNRARAAVWEHGVDHAGIRKINRAAEPPVPEENKDFRWPVLGPFRWSPRLEQVLDLAPDLIRRYPRFQDYDSLRLWGLEFAQAAGADRNRISFGVGAVREELTDESFERLRSLVREILFYRRADGPDTRHPFYRLQTERWLEALILEDMPRLFPEMAAESVYSQIPVYLGRNPGRVDILSADRRGTLTVMELKTAADPDLPVQALDYWGRVIRHNENGDFERRGYFSEVRLNRQRPKLYLVSPVFSFHDTTECLLRYLDPDLEVWKISINEDWRCGVRILRKARYRRKGNK